MKLNQKRVSEKFITERYLNNQKYFSKSNKRFFNVYETTCYEICDFFGAIVEKQGAFIQDRENHNVLKLVSHNKKIETVTGGFDGARDGQKLYIALREFLKSNLGFYELEVMKRLNSISLSNDYKSTLLFESNDGKGFYLYFGTNNYDELKIISHK
jgi:hypothetical protein